MKTRFALAWVACLACLTAVAWAQGPTYKPGKILSVKKLPAAPAQPSGPEGQLEAEVVSYDVEVGVATKVYECRYQAPRGTYVEWPEGKDVQVRVKGRVLYIKKAVEGEEKLRIRHVRTAPAH